MSDRLDKLNAAIKAHGQAVLASIPTDHRCGVIHVDESRWNALEGAGKAEKQARADLMPTEQDAINLMSQAITRLKELGWKEAIYCPKDGSEFDVIEPGSTGIHKAHYSGHWPTGGWMVADAGDFWPSHPCLYRPTEAEIAEREERIKRFREAVRQEEPAHDHRPDQERRGNGAVRRLFRSIPDHYSTCPSLSRTPSHGKVSGIAERLRYSIEALGTDGIGSNVSMSYEFACELLAALSTPQENSLAELQRLGQEFDAAPIPVEGEVIQADREAAAKLYPLVSRAPTDAIPKAMVAGKRDESHVVQAFKTYRLTFSRGVDEATALRIGWWNDMRGRGVSQDDAIAKIKAALSTIEEPRG